MVVTTVMLEPTVFPLEVTGTRLTAGAFSFVVPANVSSMLLATVGASGAGIQLIVGGGGWGGPGGGGGASAQKTMAVTAGQVVYGYVGVKGTGSTDGEASWMRVGTNAPPASNAQGALAAGGRRGDQGSPRGLGGLGGQAAACFGDTCYSGGNGGDSGGARVGPDIRGSGGGGAAGLHGPGSAGAVMGAGGNSDNGNGAGGAVDQAGLIAFDALLPAGAGSGGSTTTGIAGAAPGGGSGGPDWFYFSGADGVDGGCAWRYTVTG